ncbi:MAG: VIT domain-containing protein [Planctomycetota bacterium]
MMRTFLTMGLALCLGLMGGCAREKSQPAAPVSQAVEKAPAAPVERAGGKVPASLKADAAILPGTFYEDILSLQSDQIRLVTPAKGNLSIPYTRIDVAVENGVAFTRVLQVYHNHGTASEGYVLSMPMSPDTIVTRFSLWDKGERLPVAIADRREAERAYREVTGDETPEMKRDPGLVREGGNNRFEMRVFPIAPGESKQIELVFFRRLEMKDGAFVLDMPLAQIARSADPRHGNIASQRTDVSVLVRDVLPIRSFAAESHAVMGGASRDGVSVAPGTAEPVEFQESPPGVCERLLRKRFSSEELKDVVVKYAVDPGDTPSLLPVTYQQDGERFFMVRLLTKMPKPVPVEMPDPRRFYMGVWRTPVDMVVASRYHWEKEQAALLTLLNLNQQDSFHGSYGKMGAFVFLTGSSYLMTSHLAQFEKVLDRGSDELFNDKDVKQYQFKDVMVHLEKAIRVDQCHLVYLFLDRLPPEEMEALGKIVRENDNASFLLITGSEKDALPESWLSLPHIAHFVMREGWKKDGFFPPVAGVVAGISSFGGGLAEPGMDWLNDLWARLPNLDPRMPWIVVEGDADIQRVRGDRAGRGMSNLNVTETGTCDVFWISGRYRHVGDVRLNLRIDGKREEKEKSIKVSSQVVRISGNTRLDDGNPGNRYVGAFVVKPEVEELASRIREIPESNRSPADDARRDRLRAEAVRLSKAHQFICSETAFIAMPADLQRRYKFIPESVEQGGKFQFGEVGAGGVPEPREWVLLGMALVLGGVLYHRKRRQRSSLENP